MAQKRAEERAKKITEEFDYIIVGGGSSGSTAAGTLIEGNGGAVLVLEGGHSHHHPLLDMPPGIFKMINGSKYMTYHKTLPQDHLGGRSHEIPQGNVLGGGSSVNAQVYMRGRPSDYDEWQHLLRGCNDTIGWSWKDVLPHFIAIENNNRYANNLHGTQGPMNVSDPGYIDQFSRWFVQSVQKMGEPFNPDFNGNSQRGVGFYQFMNQNGKRSSAAYAYIEPHLKNSNLEIRLNAKVRKVIIENKSAKGVEYLDKSGDIRSVRARKGIILAAGALVTPKILMLSGIGDPEKLAAHGIGTHVGLKGVGQNLMDHPEVPVTAHANGKYGYYKQDAGWRMLLNGLQFKLFRSGRILSAGVEAGAFINPENPEDPPTLQAFCVPIVYMDRDRKNLLKDGYGLTVTTVVIKPKARGFVDLASSDPNAMPLVSPNLLGHEDDMRTMIEGQRFFVNAFQKHPLIDKIKSVAIPDPNNLSNEALTQHCKEFVKTNYHPAGTAKMGADDDPMAVLDAKMRVRGIEGLSVCDLSAMPNINAGNTNAPAMMMGRRCAQVALEK